MNVQKTALSSSIALALGIASHTAQANLTTSATLNFSMGTSQVVACTYGTTPPCLRVAYNVTDIVGSYFGVELRGNGIIEPYEKIPISSFNGIHIGTSQAASGSHQGDINGTEIPDIDNPWAFFGNTGMHQTTSPITVTADSGSTKTLDFSGWGWLWNGITVPFDDLGTTITCDNVSCSDGSNYTIDGAFHIAGAGFTTVPYVLHLEGTVSSDPVPIPAAAWLFGSGLAGLIGVARRRKA